MKFQKLTVSQKRVGAVLFALAGMVSVLFTVKSIDVHPQLVSTSAQPIGRAELPSSSVTMPNSESHIESNDASGSAIQLNRAFKNSNAIPAHVSWQMADVKAETPSIPLSEKISDYSIVELPQKAVALPALGEQISLPMLHGKTLIATVESVTNFPNGDYSWSGHLHGSGSDYPVVMTYGDHSIFATITTPEGSYTMESINGLGWLYKNPAEIELSHPDAKDFLEIEAKP